MTHRILLLALALPLFGACRSTSEASDLDGHLRHGRFAEAESLAEAWVAEAPDDPQAMRSLLRARTALLLDEGRDLTFLGHDEEALEAFYAAWELEPSNGVVAQWIDKTRRKLAERFLASGVDAEAGGDLEDAELAYQSAVDYVPDHERAGLGLERVLVKRKARAVKGERYYRDGVRRLHEVRLHEALRDFHVVDGVYLPGHETAGRKASDTQRELAQERFSVANALRQEGHLNAARNEFRIALLLDPDLTAAGDAVIDITPDIEAEQVLSTIEMLIMRGRLDEAAELAAVSAELSPRFEERFTEAEGEIELARRQDMYDTALTYEQDFDYERAVEHYDGLVAEAGFFSDAITRRETLNSYIEDAADLYRRAEEAEDPAERRTLLLQIQLIWPTYLDIEELLDE